MMRLFCEKQFYFKELLRVMYVSAPQVPCAIQWVQRLKCSTQLCKFIANAYTCQYYKVVIHNEFSINKPLKRNIYSFVNFDSCHLYRKNCI